MSDQLTYCPLLAKTSHEMRHSGIPGMKGKIPCEQGRSIHPMQLQLQYPARPDPIWPTHPNGRKSAPAAPCASSARCCLSIGYDNETTMSFPKNYSAAYRGRP